MYLIISQKVIFINHVIIPSFKTFCNKLKGYQLFLRLLPSLCESKDKFNADHMPESQADLYPYDKDNPFIKIVSEPSEINRAVSAMLEVINREKGLALDCEWRVQFEGRRKKKTESKVGLTQIAYFNKNECDRVQFLLIRTNKLRKLPGNMVQLLQDTSLTIVGVNVGG